MSCSSGVAFGQQVAALDEVAVGHGDVLALGHQVFLGFAHFRRDDELALALGFAREGNGARDFGNHGHILGLADFEQLGDSRKTTHDVAGLGGFTRLTGDDVAREHLLAVLDHDDRADGEAVDRGELAAPRSLGSPFSSQTETDGRKLVVRYSMMVMDAWCVASSSFS